MQVNGKPIDGQQQEGAAEGRSRDARVEGRKRNENGSDELSSDERGAREGAGSRKGKGRRAGGRGFETRLNRGRASSMADDGSCGQLRAVDWPSIGGRWRSTGPCSSSPLVHREKLRSWRESGQRLGRCLAGRLSANHRLPPLKPPNRPRLRLLALSVASTPPLVPPPPRRGRRGRRGRLLNIAIVVARQPVVALSRVPLPTSKLYWRPHDHGLPSYRRRHCQHYAVDAIHSLSSFRRPASSLASPLLLVVDPSAA